MKTNDKVFARLSLIALSLLLTTAHLFADGPSEFSSGTSTSDAGNYVINSTDEIYHFQGEVYDVYKVNYDESKMNLKIAVSPQKKDNLFIAYSDDYIVFYECSKEGFGAKKVMFSNPEAHLSFNPSVLMDQSVLINKRKINTKEAIDLIATSLPSARQK